jgi:hypothetical protein
VDSKLFVLLGSALICLGAGAVCSRRDQATVTRQAGVVMKTVRHANGLALRIPDGAYEVAETGAGFRLTLAGSSGRRNPIQVKVELRNGGAPPGKFPETRTVEGHAYRYRVDTEEGGSSGDEQILRAWRPTGDRHVWIEEGTAVEPPATADFTVAWQVAGAVDPPPR